MSEVIHNANSSSLADVLDRVLEKGVVIAGDISIALVGVELLTIRLRLLVASVDKAKEMGICWWETDPFLNGAGTNAKSENARLAKRIEELEAQLAISDPETSAGSRLKKPAVRKPARKAARG
ncbi:MAG: gas vesicle protein [Pseudomonadota bacterium]